MRIEQWTLTQQIGEGGFGVVWLAHNDQGTERVVKLIPKDPTSARELLFTEKELQGVQNIIPVQEIVETGTHYGLVMPRADVSLRGYLEQKGPLPVGEVITVLMDVATALEGLNQKGVVHRDLKPDNVLLWQGKWCIADFGISRYAAQSTSPFTQKYSWTPLYAAPEQWKQVRATPATDIYALGGMAFEMLEGRLPFPPKDMDQLRNDHLHKTPPTPANGTTVLKNLVVDCLDKAPETRPSAAAVLSTLRRAGVQPTGAAAQLQSVNLNLGQERAVASAAASQQQSEAERRKQIFDGASRQLKRIVDELRTQITENAPETRVASGPQLHVTLGKGTLKVGQVQPFSTPQTAKRGYVLPFEVMAFTSISVQKPRDQYQYDGRSHALWYCDAQHKGEFRWFETAFMLSPLMGKDTTVRPFAMDPTDENALIALSGTMHTHQLAWPFTPVDREGQEDFMERWLQWFASAASGDLSSPNQMPERRVHGSWRR